MKLFAVGFNAWNQLSFDQSGGIPTEPDDLHEFTCILDDARITNVRSLPTSTEVTTSRGILTAGAPSREAPSLPLKCEALNGRVAIYDEADGTVLQYLGDVEEFSTELRDVVQLVAYDVGFAALGSEGQVWTWGDSRFPECLGREVDNAAAAQRPGRVTALDDLPSGPVTKITAGGYAFAAVTRGQDMYCWGRYVGSRQHEHVIQDLTGDPEPVVVSTDDGQELDVVDVGMGDAHMIVLATDGYVYVVGSNANGQLGLGRDVSSTAPSGWTKVKDIPEDDQKVVGVYAGRKTSFILVDS